MFTSSIETTMFSFGFSNKESNNDEGGDYYSKDVKKCPGENEDLSREDDYELDTNTNNRIKASVEEADLLRSTLSDLVRNLLSDRVFANALPEMIGESIPYFSQLQYTRLPRDNQKQQTNQDSHLLKDHQFRTNLDEVYDTEHDQSLLWLSIDQENYISNRNELIPQAIQSKAIKRMPSTSSSLSDFDRQRSLEENERLKSNPNITSLIEDILENTVWNILQEAYHNEFSLTARPRLIALPPKRQSPLLSQVNLQQSESNRLNFPSPPLIMMESFD